MREFNVTVCVAAAGLLGVTALGNPLAPMENDGRVSVTLNANYSPLHIEIEFAKSSESLQAKLKYVLDRKDAKLLLRENINLPAPKAEELFHAISATADGFQLCTARTAALPSQRGVVNLNLRAKRSGVGYGFTQQDEGQWAAVSRIWNLVVDAIPDDHNLDEYRMPVEQSPSDDVQKAAPEE